MDFNQQKVNLEMLFIFFIQKPQEFEGIVCF